MNLKIGKEFNWEMSHRLPFHKGPCRNIHGHSYKMRIELEGSLNENSMILDYYDIDKIVRPLLEKLDHAFICDPEDGIMIDFLKKNEFKFFLNEGLTTAESMSLHFTNQFKSDFEKFDNIKKLRVRIYETSDAFAEVEISLNQ